MTIDAFEREFVRPRPGHTLIVGSRVYNDKPDRRLLYTRAMGIDMLDGPGVDRVVNMEVAAEVDDLLVFDHVECLSVLEHSRRPWVVAEQIERCMVMGSTLFVSVPWCWPVHAYPSDYYRISIEALEILFPSIEWKARRYVTSRVLDEGEKIKRHHVEGYPYFPRTETCGFGVKRA